jgi:AcrR family transcriptional regulator
MGGRSGYERRRCGGLCACECGHPGRRRAQLEKPRDQRGRAPGAVALHVHRSNRALQAVGTRSSSTARGKSTRAAADRAETQLSLVHYHFGGKQQLLVAVLERENASLLERQRDLYTQPGPLSDKWRIACGFLDEDIRSGYVRVLWELWAAGLTDEELAARWREAMAGWRELLQAVLATWVAELDVELPFSPRVLASLTASVFQGIEIELLAGVTEREAPHRETLEALGALIERAERR